MSFTHTETVRADNEEILRSAMHLLHQMQEDMELPMKDNEEPYPNLFLVTGSYTALTRFETALMATGPDAIIGPRLYQYGGLTFMTKGLGTIHCDLKFYPIGMPVAKINIEE